MVSFWHRQDNSLKQLHTVKITLKSEYTLYCYYSLCQYVKKKKISFKDLQNPKINTSWGRSEWKTCKSQICQVLHLHICNIVNRRRQQQQQTLPLNQQDYSNTSQIRQTNYRFSRTTINSEWTSFSSYKQQKDLNTITTSGKCERIRQWSCKNPLNPCPQKAPKIIIVSISSLVYHVSNSLCKQTSSPL